MRILPMLLRGFAFLAAVVPSSHKTEPGAATCGLSDEGRLLSVREMGAESRYPADSCPTPGGGFVLHLYGTTFIVW